MARIEIFVLFVIVNAVLSSEAAEIFQYEPKFATNQNYYPNDTLNLITLGVVNGKKYLFTSDLGATWYEASYFCNAHGMDLASIETQHENDLIMDQISKMGLTEHPLWISGHKIGRSTWLWVNGDFILFTDWGIGEPSDPNTDKCINIFNNTWSDEVCRYSLNIHGFICEERDVKKNKGEQRGLYPEEFLDLVVLDPRTEKKYLFANESANWFEASYFCNAYGMDLVTIGTQNENDLIVAHIESLGMGKLIEYWTSAHNIGRPEWFWINGDDLAFTNWAPGQPANKENAHCMYLYGGKWYNYLCYDSDRSTSGFICESRELLPPDNNTAIAKYYPTDMMNLINLGPANDTQYLFSSQTASWFAASYFCNAHGMDLVIIETQEENDAIMTHLAGVATFYWTSSHKISRATYLWINGEYMQFTDWAPEEPDNYRNFCMATYIDDWRDLYCYRNSYFICEERIISM